MRRLSLALLSCAVSAAASAAPHCFEGKLPFFQNFSRYSAPSQTKVAALRDTCRELGQPEMSTAKGGLERVRDTLVANVSFGMVGGAAASFSTLGNTPEGRRYVATLNQIRRIENPMERIRQVYGLAVRNSGAYDHDTMGIKTWQTGFLFGAHRPENLLANARRRGTVGVCREFAALLQWSLHQVARHPSSTSMALGPKDFSSSMVGGTVPGLTGWADGGGHAWVRINLPVIVNGRLRDFTHFDLDTTWYGEFTPVFPRRSGLSEHNRLRAVRECAELRQCLRSYN